MWVRLGLEWPWLSRVWGMSILGENGALESPAGPQTSRRPRWLKEGDTEGGDGVREGPEPTVQTVSQMGTYRRVSAGV